VRRGKEEEGRGYGSNLIIILLIDLIILITPWREVRHLPSSFGCYLGPS
jgi:hypothetical protein